MRRSRAKDEPDDEMTDERWRSSRFLMGMVEYFGDRISPRKQRLYAVACCRLIGPMLIQERSRSAVEVAERFAEGRAEVEELRDAEEAARPVAPDGMIAVNAASRALLEAYRGALGEGFEALLRDFRGRSEATDAILDALPGLRAAESASAHHTHDDPSPLQKAIHAFKDLAEAQAAADRAAHSTAWDPIAPTSDRFPFLAASTHIAHARSGRATPKPPWGPGTGNAEYANAHDRHADLLRCLLGNPFRPVAFDPAWRTPSVRELARTIDEGRQFDVMPILGDLLEEAGCQDAEVLGHCRETRLHARGCWLVDSILEKA